MSSILKYYNKNIPERANKIKIYQKEQIEKTYIPDTRNLSFFLLLSVTNLFVVGTNSNKRY